MVKIPRFAFEKFPGADPRLTTTMKSVGEVMSLGRNFAEALGKAMRSTETKVGRLLDRAPAEASAEELLEQLRTPVDGRLYVAEQALAAGATVEQVAEASGFDPWFVDQIALVREVGDAGPRRAVPHPGAAAPGQAVRPVRPAGRRPAAGTGRRGRRPVAALAAGHARRPLFGICFGNQILGRAWAWAPTSCASATAGSTSRCWTGSAARCG